MQHRCALFFPNAEQVEHRMEAEIIIGSGARLCYDESHFHGPHGGVFVEPNAIVRVGTASLYRSDFSLTHGRVGRLDSRPCKIHPRVPAKRKFWLSEWGRE